MTFNYYSEPVSGLGWRNPQGSFGKSAACPAEQVPGGPALLTGPVTLCARSDLDPDRFFSGRLSNIMLFDEALSPSQVAALYGEYQRQAVVVVSAPVASRRTSDGRRCAFPASFGGRLVHDCMFLNGTLKVSVEEWSAFQLLLVSTTLQL